MPVHKLRAGTVSLLPRPDHPLVVRLVDEWKGLGRVDPLPDIVEKQDPSWGVIPAADGPPAHGPRTVRLRVRWDAWQTLPEYERQQIAMRAFALVYGDAAAFELLQIDAQ